MKVAEELRYLVLAIQREGNRLLAAELKPLGITPSQAEVLRVLRDHGPLTLNALGGLLVCETSNSPSPDGESDRESRSVGVRDSHAAKQKPLTPKAATTATISRLTSRVAS